MIATRLKGHDLVLLAMYRIVYPKAISAEVNAFLYCVNFGNPFFSFYSPSQISRTEESIGILRKRGSTTSNQAYYPINLRKQWHYWDMSFPLGIANIPCRRVIDLDERGLYIKSSNRNSGKVPVGMYVRETSLYKKGEKWAGLLAICGEDSANDIAARRLVDV